jgi:PAS domain S-box-containing protein
MKLADSINFNNPIQAWETNVLEAISAHLPLRDILDRITLGIEHIATESKATILLVNPVDNCLYYGSAPNLPAEFVRATDGTHIAEGSGVCGTCAFRRQQVIATHIDDDVQFARFHTVLRKYGLKSCWSTPVLDSNDNIIATFALYYHDNRYPSEQDLQLIARCTHIVGITIERENRQKALVESEERFRGVFAGASLGIAISDLSGRIIRANPAYCMMLGYNEDELTERRILDVTHPDDRERNKTELEHLLSNRIPSFIIEKRYLHKQGHVVWGRLCVSLLRSASGQPSSIIAIGEDITTQKKTQEQLRLLNASIQRLNDIVMITEAEPISEPGPRILFVNDAFERHTGYSREEVIGRSPRFLRGPNTQPEVNQRIRKALERWQPVREEIINYKKNGEEFWLELDIVPVADDTGWFTHWVAVERDITERKRTEQVLASSQAFLRMASHMVRLGAWAVNLPDMEVEWSEEVRTIHGVDNHYEPRVENALDFYTADSRSIIQEAFQRCANDGEPYDLELQVNTADGRSIWVRSVAEAVRDANGKIVRVQGAFQDITTTKQEELERQRLAAQLDNTLESMSDAFFLLDRDWQFTYLNSEAERVLERPREELLHKTIWDEFPEAAETVAFNEYHMAMDQGFSRHFEMYYPPLENWFEINAYPSSQGLAVYFRVVTGRRQAEQALRQSEERFRLLSKATNDAIWDWDLVSDAIWWNEGFETLFGYRRTELEPDSRSWTSRIHPDERDRVTCQIYAVIDGEANDWTDRYRFLHKDGFYVHVEDRGQVIRDQDGKAVRMVGGMKDLTQQLALEEQLRQSQRLESVGQLTGGVAHDFNNLLTVILGNAELLAEELATDANLHPLAAMIANAAQSGAELTQRLLAFARRQALDPRPVDINLLVAGMEPLLRRTLGEHIDIQFLLEKSLPPALVDSVQLESALLNLCLNARDAMPNGGRLCIETALFSLQSLGYSHIDVGLAPGRYLMLAVSDNGSGIAPENMPRVFDPFFTTKDKGKGTGLGMAMVYGFIKQSGGHINLFSEPGQGTTVKLYLPLATSEPVIPPKASKTVSDPGGSETILLVEDDEMVRRFAHDQLVSLGYRVLTAPDGPHALTILRRPDPIDLLFTDVVMPHGLSGRELADKARVIRPTIKVLYTSGYTENAFVDHGHLDAGIDLLNKPYRRAELANKIRAALDRED